MTEPPLLLPPPPDPPGSRFDPDRWVLTLPVPDPGGGPRRVTGPGLAGFADPLHFWGDSLGLTYFVAPVDGAADGPARCALSQAVGWAFTDDADHVLTATVAVDLAWLPEPRRLVVAAVEAEGIAAAGAPPLLAVVVDQTALPGGLSVVHGPAGTTTPLLGGLDRDTVVTLRVAVTGVGGARRCYVFAGYGEHVAAVPGAAWPVTDFGRGGCGFTIGAVRTTVAAGPGRAVVRLSRLSVV